MKAYFFWSICIGITLCGVYLFVSKAAERSEKVHVLQPDILLDAQKNPTVLLNAILSVAQVEHNGSLASIVEGTQRALLRPIGKERWEIDNNTYAHIDKEIYTLLQQAGFFTAIKPTCCTYEYALLLGARAGTMIQRLAYLCTLIDEGYKVSRICCLVGDRPLMIDAAESYEHIKKMVTEHLYPWLNNNTFDETTLLVCKTEAQLMEWLMFQIKERIPYDIIVASAKAGKPRATTADTLEAFKNKYPQGGSMILISSQPHVLYQYAVVKNFFDSIDAAGYGIAMNKEVIGEVLDALARYVYQEQQNQRTLK